MKKHINQRKREFIYWLITNYSHSNHSVTFLLEFLMTQPKYINLIHFTDNVESTPGGIIISYLNQETPFVYFKDEDLVYTDAELVFHDLRLSELTNQAPFYFQIDIPNSYSILTGFEIFEDNEYNFKEQFDLFFSQYQEDFDYLSQLGKSVYLRKEINQALENEDFKRVQYLKVQLNHLEGESHE